MPADGAEDKTSAAAELAAQKREQRLRKFRELHLKRVSGGDTGQGGRGAGGGSQARRPQDRKSSAGGSGLRLRSR